MNAQAEILQAIDDAARDLLERGDSGVVKPDDPNVKQVHAGGIEWTIKDGIPYHVPTLMKEVKELVTKGRAERGRSTSQP